MTSMIMEGNICMCGYTWGGVEMPGWKEPDILKFYFPSIGILRDERFIFVKSSIFQTRDRQQQKI
jgi:hypothetical protein